MTRILGIDAGSRKTGFGIIDAGGAKAVYVTSGIIRLPADDLPARLKVIFESLVQLVREHCPEHMAVEEVFFAKDPRAALKLGQARGAAIVAGVTEGLTVSEYAARKVKQSVVGTGAADKAQVQHMVQRLLSLPAAPAEDAADALAVALCHSQAMVTGAALGKRLHYSRGRLKEI